MDKTVKIGEQEWMTENLNVTHFQNGRLIPEAKTDEEWEKAGLEGKPAWCYYNYDPKNEKMYGKLYNWYAVNSPKGIAPKGYHIPSELEWKQLIDFLGGMKDAGAKLKSITGWKSNGNGTNESGFSGLPCGSRWSGFNCIDEFGSWWSSSECSHFWSLSKLLNSAYSFVLNYHDGSVSIYGNYKQFGLSVRCLRDFPNTMTNSVKEMIRLKNYLENHPKEHFRELVSLPFNKVSGAERYNSIEELTNDYDIWVSAFYNEYSMKLLKLVETNHEAIKFKWLSRYILYGTIAFMIIFPALVSNYWLYFGLSLIPLAIFAMGIVKTYFHVISWITTICLILYSLFSGNYSIFGIIIPFVALLIGPRNAKLLYRKTLIESSNSSEICFKFLYYTRILVLHDKKTGEIIRAKD